MKTNYEDILRNKTDEEIWILYNKMIEEEIVQVEQDIMSEAGLDGFMNNCCKFVDKIARIPVLGKAAVNINLFCGMLVDSCKKEYYISAATKFTIMGALTYLVLPVDLIPDTIPFMGMLDDIHVLDFVARKLGNELDQYKDYLYRKNWTEFKKAINVVFSERDSQMKDGETDSKVTFMTSPAKKCQ